THWGVMRVPRGAICRAVVATSVVWLLIDVIILFRYLDTPSSPSSPPSPPQGALRGERHINEGISHDETLENIDEETRKELDKLTDGRSFSGVNSLGEMGTAADVPSHMNEDKDRRFLENQFNVVASELISVNRSLPDYRNPQCKAQKFSDLPKVSIIIVFHNEAWTTLLRTLHSVVNRSPNQLLEEIIMIDDLSDRSYLTKPLDAYIKRFPIPVHLVHLPERSGLIRARLTGSAMAKAPVLLFLDAHVEVTEGWLEPLLDRVKEDRKIVVAPIIDVISDDNFEYVTASDTTWGGFNWHLNFRWYTVPEREMRRRGGDKSAPIQTPTIAGGLFAMDKQFFYDLGSYDEGMQVWGGENLEISFRAWMCGGSLEIHPCSRVGHVFRKQTPYTFPGGTAKVIHHNAARTAEVWMDGYKEFFYKMVPSARRVDAGDMTARHHLRTQLECKSFKWYLENIYPEAPLPAHYKSLGFVMIESEKKCMDTHGRKKGELAGMTGCHGQGGNQAWSYTAKGEVRSDDLCLSVGSTLGLSGAVRLDKCGVAGPGQKHVFAYDKETGQLIHSKGGKCISASGDRLEMRTCDTGDESQRWSLEAYREEGYP
ncbi:hypothetical protein PENTCL1PPCAC_11470, partial [Pristionchus entomophagus]